MQCDLRTVSGVWSCWHKKHSKQDQKVDLSVKSVVYQIREVVINLDGLQSKAIAKTGFGEIIQAFLGFWKVRGENDSDMLGLVGCL